MNNASDIICIDEISLSLSLPQAKAKSFIQRSTVLVFGKELIMANKEQGNNKEKKKKKKEKPAPPKK